jgi:hypothetical protein
MGAGPEPGTQMALEVNDAGRLALGGTMGPEIVHIEGRLISKQVDTYELAVSSVRLIQGGTQVWSGERVSIKTEYIARSSIRHLSKGRSVAAGAVFIASVYAVIRSQNLFGLGKSDDPIPPDTSVALGIPRP